MILRPYQANMVEKAISALKKYGNTLCVAPTGAGKTLILSALAGQLLPAKSLILQHRDELVAQNLAKFQRVNPGVAVSIYDAEVKSWRGKATFGMVQTLCRPKNLTTIPKLDLLIVDESHHAVASSYLSIIQAARDQNPDVMVAGFTASPARGDGKGLRRVFSNCADQITLQELIHQGFLVPPRAFIVSLGEEIDDQLSHVRKLAGDFDMDQVEAIMNLKPVNDAVVQHWAKHAGDRKTIVFCSTIDHAKDVTAAFVEAGFRAEMVTGETPAGIRAAMLRRLKTGETQVIVNVAVLTEGFDEPSVSCIVLLRPCSQKPTMMQMIGRGLRTVDPNEYPGLIKQDCLVLDFGTSIKLHGDLDTDVNLDGREQEPGEAPTKECPECEAVVPLGVRECPICGYEFPPPETEEDVPLTDFRMMEVDILNKSPFAWVDLFGSGKVMIASGFDAWAGVFSPDGENWYALGKHKESKIIDRLAIGNKVVAIARADDFLRENETNEASKKSRRWLKDPVSQKQKELLERVGYEISPHDFGWTKLAAMAHLNFQWNKRQIEAALFRRAA